ncbi:5-(carboxyamino)imidazole ribonucleotide mutase [Kangiella sp. HZ709]|uniref:5-(carboxyamino)imidazole ribonucleotide mutase n=1 Tax=Kangiella sp. HZ709 TaxID=2666328 RepID=UPI0012AF2E9C|nr:5-(carboxyamino)imidazole ribonucleotide mutase [Kangiella sp. HZ709]MRX27602.1 5-(carboxyamino)imidazole ribonucleotide mutase [Kangiella sp. HZ709]
MSFDKAQPLVSIVMGSKSDWSCMQKAADSLDKIGVPYEVEVVSAHRTPGKMYEFAQQAESRGIEVIIAGAGGAAHLPGMVAAITPLPVLGVPVKSRTLNGVDSLLSIAQMPAGIPVGTLAIGDAGSANAGLFAASILANKYPEFKIAIKEFRAAQTQTVMDNADPREAV